MKRWNEFILVGVIVLIAGLYGTLWNAPSLTWDDNSNIFANPYFMSGQWGGLWTDPYFGLFVPVTSSWWALLYWWGEGQVWPFRLANLGLHILNIKLVYALLSNLYQRLSLQSPIAIGWAVGIFALHPLQVGAVAWISGGRDLLATTLALLATLLYFARRSPVGHAGALGLFILALLSKPSVVILPLALLLADIKLEGRSFKHSFRCLIPWFIFALIAVVVTHAAQVEHFSNNVEWWWRPVIMLDTYKFYLQKLLLPWPLSANYARTPETVIADVTRLGLALGFWLVMGALIWRWTRARWVVGLWLIILLPVSGLVPFGYQQISGVADHYNYPAMIPIAMLLMHGSDQLWNLNRKYLKIIMVMFATLALTGWALVTWRRLPTWNNDRNFYTDMALSAPDSYNTAIGMSVVLCDQSQEYEAGVAWTEKAMLARPNDILALANRAYCLLHSGRTHAVIEMEFYLDKIDIPYLTYRQPTGYSSLLGSIGSAMIQERQFQTGFQYLCEAYAVKPSEPNHARNLKVAAEILEKNGLTPRCDGQGQTE